MGNNDMTRIFSEIIISQLRNSCHQNLMNSEITQEKEKNEKNWMVLT
jgi:hypothetical protein